MLRAQCIHKAPITQLKQVDHTINERRLLEAVSSDFCVRLYGAFQDPTDLMLLQEWVGGECASLLARDLPPLTLHAYA